MLLFIKRFVFTTLATVAFTGAVRCQDTTAKDLHQSRERFNKAEAEFGEGIRTWLDSLESKARSRGDRGSVVKIKSIRESFEKTGEAPDNAPRQLLRKRDAACAKLRREYDLIIGKLTRLGFDSRAEAAESELQKLLSGTYRVKWLPIFKDGRIGPNVSNDAFTIVNGMLVCQGDGHKLLFCMTPLKNFRVRIKYRVSQDCRAALLFRVPNARKKREVGYSVGLNSKVDWIYNPNRAFRFVHATTSSKKLLDYNAHPTRGVTSHDEFHIVEVIAAGNRFSTILDGRVLYNFADDAYPEGALGIGFQQGTLTVESFEFAALQ